MAQSAESALIVRMEATLKKFEAQMAKAQGLTNRTAKGMEDRMATMNRNIARNAERAGEAIGRAGGRTMMIQNASFQLQDFAVQVAAGTSASQALGQQLPQLLGGFGAFGAAAGAAVAILGPLVGSLFETGASAGDASAALKRLSDATDGLRSMTEMSSEDIIKRYGAITEELELVLNKKQELAEFEAREAARGAISGLADNGIISAAAQVRELQQRLAEYEAMSVDEARALGIGVADNILLANESIGVITESLGLTVEEIYRVSDALEAWSSANSLYEQADAASAVLAAISGTSLETSEWGRASQMQRCSCTRRATLRLMLWCRWIKSGLPLPRYWIQFQGRTGWTMPSKVQLVWRQRFGMPLRRRPQRRMRQWSLMIGARPFLRTAPA
ncbi:hypothetical protein ACFSHQ_17980 [Gemmobacter lanyuensis]